MSGVEAEHENARRAARGEFAAWACPRCGGVLIWTASSATCTRCGAGGSLRSDGVYEFDASDVYWGEIDRELMRTINGTARERGWRQALESHLRPAHPDLVDYVDDASRADWRVLLPLDRARTVVLDVGAGWGANSFGVAADVACVVAVEKIGERIDWIAARAREDGVENLIPVRAELQWLPFAPGSFDVVVANGVLEWAGLADPEPQGGRSASPRVLQEQFLRRLEALLRPGGWLYVGIENRFGRMFLMGAPDHQGLRFTSLMPKPVASAYTAFRAIASPRTPDIQRDYRTWIYSLSGYRRLLENCGFADVRAYAAIPGYNRPSTLVPLDGSVGPMRWFRNHARPRPGVRPSARRAVARALAATGLEAWTTNEYALVARRPAA
jgi:SAM-dependent methyltransferase